MIKSFILSEPWEPPKTKMSGFSGLKPQYLLANSFSSRFSRRSLLTGLPVRADFLPKKSKVLLKETPTALAKKAERRFVNPGTASDS